MVSVAWEKSRKRVGKNSTRTVGIVNKPLVAKLFCFVFPDKPHGDEVRSDPMRVE